MTHVRSHQSLCRLGIARADITPPIGMYHRMWGAAKHDVSIGVHRPLTATAVALQDLAGGEGANDTRIVVAMDHCLLEGPDVESIKRAIEATTGLDRGSILLTFSHTHAAGLMSRGREELPGGELIGPYLDDLRTTVATLAK